MAAFMAYQLWLRDRSFGSSRQATANDNKIIRARQELQKAEHLMQQREDEMYPENLQLSESEMQTAHAQMQAAHHGLNKRLLHVQKLQREQVTRHWPRVKQDVQLFLNMLRPVIEFLDKNQAAVPVTTKKWLEIFKRHKVEPLRSKKWIEFNTQWLLPQLQYQKVEDWALCRWGPTDAASSKQLLEVYLKYPQLETNAKGVLKVTWNATSGSEQSRQTLSSSILSPTPLENLVLSPAPWREGQAEFTAREASNEAAWHNEKAESALTRTSSSTVQSNEKPESTATQAYNEKAWLEFLGQAQVDNAPQINEQEVVQ